MWKWLKSKFGGRAEKTTIVHLEDGTIVTNSQKVIDEYEEKMRERKEEWQRQNELNRKRDMCYLNTTSRYFDGTYEQFMAKYQAKLLQQQGNAAWVQQQYACAQSGRYPFGMRAPYQDPSGVGLGGILGIW